VAGGGAQVVRRCPRHMDTQPKRSVSRQISRGSDRGPPPPAVRHSPSGRHFDALALGCDQTPFAEVQ